MLLELCAGGAVSVHLPHVPHVRNGGAHPMVHGVFELEGQLAWACFPSLEPWQDLLAELPQHARLLGVHVGRKGYSGSKIWTLLTARVKKTKNRKRGVSHCLQL